MVLRIFTDYVAGATPREIAKALNAEDVKPPRGTRWSASTINGNRKRSNGMLLNPLYAGRLVWNKVTMSKRPGTDKRVIRPNARDAVRYVPATPTERRTAREDLGIAADQRVVGLIGALAFAMHVVDQRLQQRLPERRDAQVMGTR